MIQDQFVGVFYDADNVRNMRLAITDKNGVAWGTAVATGYAVAIQCRIPGAAALTATVTGSWEDSTDGAALFTVGNVSALQPAAGLDSQDYDFLVYLTKSSNVARIGYGPTDLPFRFRVAKWPV